MSQAPPDRSPYRRLSVNVASDVADAIEQLQSRRGKTVTQMILEALREQSLWPAVLQPDGSRLVLSTDGQVFKLVPATARSEPLGKGVSVEVPTPPLPIWASPQAVALAAWLTAILTLIAVILAVAAMEKDQGPAPAPVQIVIMPPTKP